MNLSLSRYRKRVANEQGQSLVIAIIVMFLLVFVGVIFVALVARNQTRAGRSKEVIEAGYLAEAGIQYADKMLRTSEDGADWRPAPDALAFTWDPAGDNGSADPNAKHWIPVDTATLADYAAHHPDFQWLRPWAPEETTVDGVPNAMGPTGGYTSFTMGDGRYLLRVSYNPDPSPRVPETKGTPSPVFDPMSKYIKIEAVGRIGVVDPSDPTTWQGNVKLRRELTAYKPIGVTDYVRFVTNKEKRSAEIPLGAAGFDIRYEGTDQDRGPVQSIGASIRVNGNLKWYGRKVDLNVFGKSYVDNPANVQQTLTMPTDMIEVSGDISQQTLAEAGVVSGSDAKANNPIPVTLNETIVQTANGSLLNLPLLAQPSNPGPFTTAGGFYRDGSNDVDAENLARSIKRLEPPLIDSDDTPTRVPRYVGNTRDSGVWIDTPNGQVNSGAYGWGRGVYIDNTADLQPESETLFGGYTPRADWMKPNNRMSSFWQGPYYVPPAVIITLNPFDTDGDKEPDITITRTDIRPDSANEKAVWLDAAGSAQFNYDATGKPVGEAGVTYTIPYPQGTQSFKYWVDTNKNGVPDSGEIKTTPPIIRNGVIYAEGNIRIHGMMAPGKQLTVVSGGIIYVDGNVLKYRKTDLSSPKNPVVTVDQTCAISLLAKQYVCVNTTQFVSLLTSTGPGSFASDSEANLPPYHLIVTPEPGATFVSTFSFGDVCLDPMLFVRHAGQYGPAYINMALNSNVLDTIGLGLMPSVYGVGDPNFAMYPGTGLNSLFEHRVWNLNTIVPPGILRKEVGYPNTFEVALNQSSVARNNYLLSKFTIQPMDIRIEAAIYAQERSFFVIPGEWFNQNPTDVPVVRGDGSISRAGTRRPPGTDPRWPFFGEPLDVRITICGAVTENLPASVADVNEWYSKWANIPPSYGSSDIPTVHPGDGLTFTYDGRLDCPLSGGFPIRADQYGRALPVTPSLPVCESLIYFGEPT